MPVAEPLRIETLTRLNGVYLRVTQLEVQVGEAN